MRSARQTGDVAVKVPNVSQCWLSVTASTTARTTTTRIQTAAVRIYHNIHTYTHERTHTRTHTHIHTHIHTYTYIHILAHAHKRTHTHVRTHRLYVPTFPVIMYFPVSVAVSVIQHKLVTRLRPGPQHHFIVALIYNYVLHISYNTLRHIACIVLELNVLRLV